MAERLREQAAAKAAITLMADWNITPTPDNYELFYVYASGSSPALAKVIESMAREHTPFTGAVLQDLATRFLARDRDVQTVDEVGGGISSMIDAMLQKLEKAGKDAGDYGRALSAASGELGSDQSPAAVAVLVDRLVGATKAMETRAKLLESELQRSSNQVNDLKTQLDTVRKESRLDPLTNLANRKTFDFGLKAAIDDARYNNTSVAVLMCDIDHFKRFNDNWGHQTGDQVLRLVSQCLSENVKGRDTAARYGGEEFVVILRQTTLAGAVAVASQIRTNVEKKRLVKKSTGDILGTITISIGVSELKPTDTADILVQRADRCLYTAKNTGRNRVVAEDMLLAASDAA